MATRTSVGSGLWSAAGTWNTGVPADTDTAIISAGHTVTYDADQSGFATGLAGLQVLGTFVASEVPGSYYLKMAGHITGGGYFKVGASEAVPYPATCALTIFLNGAYRLALTRIGGTNIYCTAPVTRWVKLTADALLGATVLQIDADLRADAWHDGDTVCVVGITGTRPDAPTHIIAAGGIGASTLTLTVGLVAGKAAGSYVALLTRNVRIVSTKAASSFATYSMTANDFACEFTGFERVIYTGFGNRLLRGSTAWSMTYLVNDERCAVCRGVYVNAYILNTTVAATFVDAFLGGSTYGAYNAPAMRLHNCVVAGNSRGITRSDPIISNSVFAANEVADIVESDRVRASNSVLGMTLSSGYCAASTYIESRDHNGVAGAFLAKSNGGTVADTASPVVTGRPRSYAHACASATYPCWHQREITVEAGRQLRARVWLRHEAGVAVVAQLVLPTDDPILDPAATAEDTFDASALAADAWHEDILTWTNTATYPQQILLRFLATAAAGNAYSDFEWAFDRSPGGRHGIA